MRQPEQVLVHNAGDSISVENANWTFSGNVCENFDQHVARSVPFYDEGHDLVAKISDFFLQPGSLCYELGCSTGALSYKLAKHNEQKKDIRFIDIDKEKSMIKKAQDRCAEMKNVSFICADVMGVEMEKADLIVSYYTIQFVKPKNRQIIFDRIFDTLTWGGALILFEKVRAPDARFQDMMTAIYNDFKLDRGYNSEEIIAKSRSLKGILEPFSTGGNLDLLKRAGFVDIMTIMKYVCFEGFLVIK
ncbi:MAG: methyltransferase domain-containing protein [Planctomycetota bacterium]